MRTTCKRLLVSAVIALALASGAAMAAVQSDNDSMLSRIDLATGVTTSIGDNGSGSIEGLLFKPGNGIEFDEATGIPSAIPDEGNSVYTNDATTGAGTLVAKRNRDDDDDDDDDDADDDADDDDDDDDDVKQVPEPATLLLLGSGLVGLGLWARKRIL